MCIKNDYLVFCWKVIFGETFFSFFGLFFDLFIPVAGEKIKIFQKITLENKNLDLFTKFMIIRSFFCLAMGGDGQMDGRTDRILSKG